MPDSINTVCVCGSGTMGSGIAQVIASAGIPTILYDVNKNAIEKAKQGIANNLQKLVEKGKLTESETHEINSRLYFTADMEECRADLIIEAIVEKLEAKLSLFQQLALLNPKAILTSNTSSLSITTIAEQLPDRSKLAGLHFFNPAPLMKLVELVTTVYTDPIIVEKLGQFIGAINKAPVVCKDAPGFIVNRVARPFYIESLRLLEEETTSLHVIDQLLEGQGFKMGPFKLMDLIGNDINYAVSCSVYEQLGQPQRLKPSYIQKEKVEKGELGKKTKKGYYNYTND